MHRYRIIIIELLLGSVLAAHGGFDHVLGTVVKVDHDVITVHTAKGNVDVRMDQKTEMTKDGQKAASADLLPGARVVVDVPEGSKENVAHSIKIGALQPR